MSILYTFVSGLGIDRLNTIAITIAIFIAKLVKKNCYATRYPIHDWRRRKINYRTSRYTS